MKAIETPVYLSAIDEQRFGIRTAKISEMTSFMIPSVMEFCRSNKVVLLIARCLVKNLETAQMMEKRGFTLMDTLIYYSRRIPADRVPTYNPKIQVRPFTQGEEQIIKEIASKCFSGYSGHYHADPRLDSARCDEVYVSWAINACASRGETGEVLVAERENIPAGFLTLGINNPEESEVGLFCISPEHQGSYAAQSLVMQGLKWSTEKGVKRMITSTQIVNIASQKVWLRMGFEPDYAFYTFHKWFDENM